MICYRRIQACFHHWVAARSSSRANLSSNALVHTHSFRCANWYVPWLVFVLLFLLQTYNWRRRIRRIRIRDVDEERKSLKLDSFSKQHEEQNPILYNYFHHQQQRMRFYHGAEFYSFLFVFLWVFVFFFPHLFTYGLFGRLFFVLFFQMLKYCFFVHGTSQQQLRWQVKWQTRCKFTISQYIYLPIYGTTSAFRLSMWRVKTDNH